MMNFAFKTRKFALKTRNVVSKTRDFAFKMTYFAGAAVRGVVVYGTETAFG